MRCKARPQQGMLRESAPGGALAAGYGVTNPQPQYWRGLADQTARNMPCCALTYI